MYFVYRDCYIIEFLKYLKWRLNRKNLKINMNLILIWDILFIYMILEKYIFIKL